MNNNNKRFQPTAIATNTVPGSLQRALNTLISLVHHLLLSVTSERRQGLLNPWTAILTRKHFPINTKRSLQHSERYWNYTLTQWKKCKFEVWWVSEKRYCCGLPFVRTKETALCRNCLTGLCGPCPNQVLLEDPTIYCGFWSIHKIKTTEITLTKWYGCNLINSSCLFFLVSNAQFESYAKHIY